MHANPDCAVTTTRAYFVTICLDCLTVWNQLFTCLTNQLYDRRAIIKKLHQFPYSVSVRIKKLDRLTLEPNRYVMTHAGIRVTVIRYKQNSIWMLRINYLV